MKERLEAIKKAALEKIEQADNSGIKRNEGRSQRRTSDRWTDGQ